MNWKTLSALFFVLGVASIVAADKPNILLIVSDDQGWHDLGAIDSTIITPNLDRLADEGTRLTNFYVAWPACTPSRASLLTGRYPQRNGIYDMIRNEAPDYGYKYKPAEYEVSFERIGGMDLQEKILPAFLKENGYKSGIYGKWDLGTLKRYLPTSRGFDDFYGFVNTGIDYYTHERYGVPSMYRNLEPTLEDKGTYCTYLFEREALRFLNEREEDDAPFFLYVPFNAPHSSSALEPEIRSTVQAPPEFLEMYPEVEQEYREGKKYGKPAKTTTPEKRRRDYSAAVTCMDASIGKMLDVLDQRGIADNTIVIFFSDNGGGGGSNDGPLRGKKGDTWEGGVRVISLVKWPAGGIPAGTVNDAFLTSLELVPSLLSATNTANSEEIVFDGYDWWPTLRGEASSPRDQMFWERKDTKGARVGAWKWVDMGSKGSGLFNLEEDLAEENDLSKSHPEKLEEMKAHFSQWKEQMEQTEPRGPFRNF